MTIGERLEDGRKRSGISIREAAEATKVRGDYLLAMEENNMQSIPLPEIYKRGFLKNYARFLKLDPEKLIADYEAKHSGRSLVAAPRSGERERPHERPHSPQREVFGRMELPDDEEEEAPHHGRAPVDLEEPPRERPARRPLPPVLTDNTLYLKIAAGAAAVAVLTLLMVLLINLLRGDPEESPQTAGSGTTTTAPVANTAPVEATNPSRSSTLTIRAQESVTLIIDQVDPAERLYQGTLGAGEVIPIEREGPVSIRFSNGAALTIEQANGQTIRPTQASIGRVVVP